MSTAEPCRPATFHGNPRRVVSIYLSRMWRHLLIDVALGALVVTIWYWTILQLNRRRCVRILRWIDKAFGSDGHIGSVHWVSPSRFKVQLRLANCGFLRPSLLVQLPSDELPFRCLVNYLRRKRRQTLTFEADLHCPPSFNLQVLNHRWCGKSRRRLSPQLGQWTTERLTPIIVTTRNDWNPDIANMMNASIMTRDCEFLSVAFRRTTPHFTATLPLDAIIPEKNAEIVVLEALRELASGASASRF